jgi:hypothetical protein
MTAKKVTSRGQHDTDSDETKESEDSSKDSKYDDGAGFESDDLALQSQNPAVLAMLFAQEVSSPPYSDTSNNILYSGLLSPIHTTLTMTTWMRIKMQLFELVIALA